MKISIDGINYVPESAESKVYTEALNAMTCEGLTVKEYLETLLIMLWKEREGFNSTRPFGTSRWEYDLYHPLIDCGFIPGVVSDNGEYAFFPDKAHEKVLELIRYLSTRSN